VTPTKWARLGWIAAAAAIALVAGLRFLPTWLASPGIGGGRSTVERTDPSGTASGYDYEPPAPGTYDLPALQAAGDGRVLGADSSVVALRDLVRGRVTLLSFIYTRCADATACPLATGVLREIHAAGQNDPELSRSLRLITLSFDPQHDTPAVMADYASVHRDEPGGPEWLFLTSASPRDLAPILESYGQRVNRKPNPASPLGPLYHLLRVYLIDRDGMIRNIYSSGLLDPRLVLADVRTLMLEEHRKAHVAAAP